MRILVSFKVTPDYEALREADWAAGVAGSVETRYVRRILNCFDESALELALRLTEAQGDRDIAADLGAVTVAGREAEPFLRTLQALGYERAARVEPGAALDFAPAVVAKIIAGYARQVHGCDLLLLGCRSGPGDGGTVPFLVAEHLRWPCLSQVVAIEPLGDDRLRVTSVADDGLLRVTLRLPCVLAVGNAVVSRLRVPTLTQRLVGRAEELAVLSPGDVGVDLEHELGREGRILTGVATVDRARHGVVIHGATTARQGADPVRRPPEEPDRGAVRYAAVIDGTLDSAARQASCLGAFLHEGLSDAAAIGETVVFYHEERDRERLVDLAPTRDVRLVRVPERRPDVVIRNLATVARRGECHLFLFPAGHMGTELAARLAFRAGGTALTDVLGVEAAKNRLVGRKSIYSGHVVGRFELSTPPWCVSVDARWNDETSPAAADHRIVVSDVDETSRAHGHALRGHRACGRPSVGDLADCRLLVVAGKGAGSRRGVERIAEAARRMGAAFGVTRPVAMSGWAPLDRIVGVSGARTAPAVCIVAGASGAPAFLWGIENAVFIAAIDLDEQAPIVAAADATIIADCVAVVEELAKLVSARDRRR